MNSIRNIIFDFGGVIYDIDYNKTVEAFSNIGIEDFDLIYSKTVQNHLFENLESGLITSSQFRRELNLLNKTNISDQEIDNAWNALLIGFHLERIKLIEKIRKNYNIYLLSNSNKIHFGVFLKEFQEMSEYSSFNDIFIKAYFSFNIKCRKPDITSYKYVLKDAALKAKETLFIDDSIQNIELATKLGVQTYFLDLKKGEDLLDLFENGKFKMSLLK
jgi:putative hydrolase of the HAD superfamily